MANVIQLKRGNEAQRTGFTPAAGEPIFILDENKMYIGDGSTAAQSLSALGGDLTMANGSNNRVMTATSSSGMNAEANLTFDGSTLAVTGDATVSDDLGLVSDSAKLTFGANSEVVVEHVHNVGLTLKHTATADDKPIALTLQTGETDIAADDVLGKIAFQAPDEGTGTDAILVAAEIAAISEGDFSSSSNATSLHFRTGSSAAAADRIILTSAGHLVPAADNTSDLGTSSLEFKDGYFDGTLYADAINFNGTAISATAAELNIMDGVTSTAAELNILDGVTSTAAELNILDGVTATAAELNLVDGGTSRGTTAVADGDGFLHNDGGTMRMTNVSKIADLFAGTGIDASSSVLSTAAAQTGITSILATDLKVGEDDQTKIDFETANEIHFYADNAEQVYIADGIFGPQTDNDVDLGASGAEFKDAFFDGTVTTDALIVGGNTTVQNILAGTTANTIQFEGSTADDHETTLGVIDPTGDRTINLPNVSGTIPVLAAASTTAISATPAEINLIDGGTSRGTTALASGDGFLHNDAGTMRMTSIDKIADLAAGTGLSASSGVLSIDAAQTGITSLLATDIKIGEDDQTKIDFETADEIHFYAANAEQVYLADGIFGPQTDNDVDLGASGVEWKDAYFDGTVTTDGLTVSSTTNLDGAVQLDNTLTVGVDDTGHDVKLFGATSGAYIMWDESNNELLTAGAAIIDIVKDKLQIGGTAVTTTAAELNLLDGVTSTTAELNILDGVTSTAAELNILDGVTSTAAELNVLDGITAVVGELNALDLGSTAVGTAIASKAVVLDSNKDYTGIRNFTITGTLDGATISGGTF